MSDRQFLLRYDVLETSSDALPPGIKVSHSLKLRKITYSNQTVIEFSTKYSDQISLAQFIKSKQNKRKFFDALRRVCTDPDDSGNKPWNCHICTFQNTSQNVPQFKCAMCQQVHMFTKLFRIPCDVEEWTSKLFVMCGHEWKIIIKPEQERSGWIGVFLKCIKLRHNARHFPCHFI